MPDREPEEPVNPPLPDHGAASTDGPDEGNPDEELADQIPGDQG